MKTTDIAIATNGGSAKAKGVYVSGTERLVAVTAEPLTKFEWRMGHKARWVITHVCTGMGMANFDDKARAIHVARELFGKLPLSFWRSQDGAEAELAPPDEVVAWLRQARKEQP